MELATRKQQKYQSLKLLQAYQGNWTEENSTSGPAILPINSPNQRMKVKTQDLDITSLLQLNDVKEIALIAQGTDPGVVTMETTIGIPWHVAMAHVNRFELLVRLFPILSNTLLIIKITFFLFIRRIESQILIKFNRIMKNFPKSTR